MHNDLFSSLTAAQHERSKAISAKLIHEINHHGPISFAAFMQYALYYDSLGYYQSEDPIIGQSGDFITAPEISALFSYCVAEHCLESIKALQHHRKPASIVEFGAGLGTMAADILLYLDKQKTLPERYVIVEISNTLKAKQQHTIHQKAAHLLPRVQWICPTKLNELSLDGIIIANELLDALPFQRFQIKNNQVLELGVDVKDNQFTWTLMNIQDKNVALEAERLLQKYQFTENTIFEMSLEISTWMKEVSQLLNQGTLLLLDYGYHEAELYHPKRTSGTLKCHFRHHVHDQPLLFPGLQDITYDVNFSYVNRCAEQHHWQLKGYTNQAMFLLASGIADKAQEAELNTVARLKQSQALQYLTMPSQMGEVIKAIAFTKGVDVPLPGFALKDFTHYLSA